MKVCPVCNESFGNELNFCDIDGVRLKRERGDDESGSQGKMWQFLGVGLLLGALVLSVISVFMPKSRVAPITLSSEPAPSASNSSQPVAAEPSGPETTEPTFDRGSSISAEEIALAEIKSKEKAVVVTDLTNGLPSPNPKAAALAAEETEQPALKIEESKVVPEEPKISEPASTTKAVSETREPEPPSKPAITPPRPDPKKPGEAKPAAKDSSKKKSDDKNKEKKGGFLRVFKKIFGKD